MMDALTASGTTLMALSDYIYYFSNTMLIQEQPLNHWIDHFYGYGSWESSFWFVAYEEGGGDMPEEVAEKLDYFYEVHATATEPTLCDLREAFKHVTVTLDGPKSGLFKNLYDYRFDSHAIQHGVWKNLIAFEHGYRNEDLPDLLAYQKNFFALSSLHNEALIRLYPLPSPHNHAWYYSWLDMPQFSFLKSRALYQDHLYPTRIRHLMENIRRYKPEIVLMYGMQNINILKKSVQTLFPHAGFRTIKAIKQTIPQHHRADLGGTTLLITTQIPALRHNRIETGFDWQGFGKAVRELKSGQK